MPRYFLTRGLRAALLCRMDTSLRGRYAEPTSYFFTRGRRKAAL